MNYAIELKNIRKTFGNFVANDDISINLKKGEVLALLGENGAGKSTLMNILFGIYQKDSGDIFINGEKVDIKSPIDADIHKIGMVHQHFKLVEAFTVVENIILTENKNGFISKKEVTKKIEKISKKLNLLIDPNSKVSDITVGMQQRVEIIKMLYKDSDILIFDEPTAVLTPNEIVDLKKIIDQLKSEGKAIILITHKLKEIKQMADRCSVIRKGKFIDTVNVKDTNEKELANLMVGRSVLFETNKIPSEPKEVKIKLDNLIVKDNIGIEKVKNFSLEVRAGEIVGVAGISGNGQDELIEAITGIRKVLSGHVYYNNLDFTNKNAKEVAQAQIAHIPADRIKYGIVEEFELYESMIMHNYHDKQMHPGHIINKKTAIDFTNEIIDTNDVRTSEAATSISKGLSGGNQQKAIIGRELALHPGIIIASQPTRGIDVGAIESIHKKLIAQRDEGKAVLIVSYELDEILNLSDRIAVMFEGKVIDILERSDATEQKIGILMAGKEL